MDLPDCITSYLSDIERSRLYGKPILDYSKEELAAYIMWMNEDVLDRMEEKHRQFKMLRGVRGE